jgi:hypothetical protein
LGAARKNECNEIAISIFTEGVAAQSPWSVDAEMRGRFRGAGETPALQDWI